MSRLAQIWQNLTTPRLRKIDISLSITPDNLVKIRTSAGGAEMFLLLTPDEADRVANGIAARADMIRNRGTL